MNRTRGRSVSQAQDDVVTNIDSHLDFVKRVLKWSISDLDRVITLLRARIATEEAYILSLSKLTRTTEPTETTPLFGEKQPSFLCATFYYEQSIEHTIQQRKELIQGIRVELDKLVVVKEGQEARRKMVKQVQGEKNANYATYRTGELVKLKKTYSKKCSDLQAAQQQFEQQQQQQHQQQQYLHQPSYDDINLINDYLPPQHSHRRSYDENKRLSSDSLGDNDASSIHSLNHQDSAYKKGMANFMASVAQVRTQFANVSTGTTDLNKQNTKYAKFKKEIMDADHDYRNGIRQLERLRKQQVSGAMQTMKHLEIAIIDKAEVTQSCLCGILDKEHLALVNEIKTNELCQRYAIEINAEKDLAAFNIQYRKLYFRTPEPLRYENYYFGSCKYILFGGSLMEYYAEHDRAVPLLVTKCVEAIDSVGLQKEGIYRVSGRQSNVESLKHAFEQDETIDIDRKYDVFTIATVLKIYLRQLEEPLLKIDMTTRVKYTELKDKQRQLMYLQTILSGLSKPHRDTLLVVIRHLARVNANSHINKMTLQNLSVIFTPAIFHDFNQAEHPGEWHVDTVFEDLLTYYDALFTNAEIQSRAKAGPQPPITIKTSTTATDYPPPSNAPPTNLLLTAAMGPPPMAMMINDDSPTTPTNRSASLAALTRSGTLQHSRSQGSSLQQMPATNNAQQIPGLHQQQQQPLYQYQHPQTQQQQQQPSYQQQSYQQQSYQQQSYQQPHQQQSNYQQQKQSSYHHQEQIQQYQQPQPQQKQQNYQHSQQQEQLSTTTPSHAPTRPGYSTYVPKLQMQNLTISTDKWQPPNDGEKTIEEDDETTAGGGGGGDNQLRSPVVDDLRGGGSMKHAPPRQDSLKTINGGSANSSTSSLAAAVTHTANMVAAGSSGNIPPSTKSRASPSAPQQPHMAQPVVIAAQQHFPSSAQIVPTYSSPVTPGPSDATN